MAVFTFTRTNTTPVAIPDATTGFPNVPSLVTQSVNVFVSGTITDVNFTVTNLSHTWANDLDMALFGPNAANNLVLMSDVGGSSDLSNTTLTFDDAGSSNFLNDNTSIGSGNYRPTNHLVSTGSNNINPDETTFQFGFSTLLNSPGPTGGATLATVFNGTSTLGNWTFAVSDDGIEDTGSFGTWLLQLETAGSVTVIAGTAGADVLSLVSSSATAGSISFNGTTAEYSGLDTVYFNTGGGADQVFGGQASETIIDGDALDGDTFNANAGYDTIDYSTVSFLGAGYTTVTFDLVAGTADSNTGASETIANFENLIASDTNDTVLGTADANMIRGEAGNDELIGYDGNDLLYGGDGNDSLYGGDLRDEYYGGLGNDVLRVDQVADNVAGEVFDGGDDIDTIFMSSFGNFTHDLRDDTLVSIEALTIDTNSGSTGEARILASQIGAGLAVNLHVTGSADPNVADRLVIDMTGVTALDLSNFVMTEFGGPNDRVVVNASSGARVVIFGTAGADEIHGSINTFDALYGGGGNDSLYGEEGNDDLYGGLGADAFFGGSGSEDWVWYTDETENLVINLADASLNVGAAAAGDTYDGIEGARGGAGNDSITGNSGANQLHGGSGNDTLVGGAGADRLTGGGGTRDVASYSDSATGLRADLTNAATNTGIAAGDFYDGIEDLLGSALGDTLVGNTGGNRLLGESGNDAIEGRDGADTLDGGEGNDTLTGGIGADQLVGGNGTDMAVYWDSVAGVRADMSNTASNTGIAAGDTYSGIENLAGTNANDALVGEGGANYILGFNGIDAIEGRGGNDTLDGGDGNDILLGGAGADSLIGGTGIGDMAAYWDSATGLRVDLQVTANNTGIAVGDTYTGIEDIGGTNLNDTLNGDSGANRIIGFNGADVIESRAGNDTLDGGEGNDSMGGGLGADSILGGNGRDLAYFWDSTAGGVTARLDILGGNTGFATGDVFNGIEDIAGTNFADVLVGDATGNTLLGAGGNDTLFGNAGNDTLQGGAGNDSIYGMAGNDLLAGEAGQDSFVFEGSMGATNVDRIIDFSSVDDTIVLENALFTTLANGNLAANQVAFGAAATLGTHRVIYNSATGQLFYDADGLGGTAQVHLATLNPGTVLALADFLVI